MATVSCIIGMGADARVAIVAAVTVAVLIGATLIADRFLQRND